MNLRTGRFRECGLEHLEAQIWKNYPVGANYGGAFVDSMYVQVCPKKLNRSLSDLGGNSVFKI